MRPWMRLTLWLLVIFGAIYGVFRYFFVEFHRVGRVTTDPMNWANSPNLEPADLVLVWRSKPSVGELARCIDPSAPASAPRWLIARVIGVAGDKIDWAEGQLRINGFRVRTAGCVGAPRPVLDESGNSVEMSCYSEELGGGKHDVQVRPNGFVATHTEQVVAPGKLYVLSDTRSSPWAHDSRTPEVGQIDEGLCTGHMMLRIVSKKGWSDSDRRLGYLL